jgi:D-psicose/D-tagatose/L-ribulose 3-epimerase
MKYGMNMLLWTSDVSEEHFPILESLKSMGYDGVELPIFDMELSKFQKVGAQLDKLGLERTAVTVCTDDENPISTEAPIRAAGLVRLKKAIDMCAGAGCTHLCGPIHSAIGRFTGSGPTEDEWKWGKEILAQAADYAQQ